MQVSSMYRLHIGSEDIIFQMPSLLNDNCVFALECVVTLEKVFKVDKLGHYISDME